MAEAEQISPSPVEQTNEQRTDERIVVIALDGSIHSDFAFEWYLVNCRRPYDNVTIVTVFDRNSGAPVYGSNESDTAEMTKQYQSAIAIHKQQSEAFQEKLNKAGIKGEVVVYAGKPGEVVVNVAQDKKAHLIICGSRGQGVLRRTIMGSISSYIVHNSTLPVIVCRNKSFPEST